MAQTAEVVQLQPPTLLAFEAYIHDAQAGMDKALDADANFLWSDVASERAKKVQSGQIVAELWSGKTPLKIPQGLIHDWVAAVFVAHATVQRTLALIQDYDNHKRVYQPDVMESKLIAREGNDFKIYLRLLKKKILTVILDTDHDVQYNTIDERRCLCRSSTTRISEVHNAGKSNENVLPADTGYGFLWRMNTEWRFRDSNDGVWIECRAISLTRDVPSGLGWILEPIVRKLPGESLINTLKATRRALQH